MSDFDFDEIDKAVNSALNSQTTGDSSRSSEVNRQLNVPTRGSASLSPVTPSRDVTSNQDSSSTTAVDEDINAAVNSIVADVTVTSQASSATTTSLDANDSSKPGLPTRRSGRFMDVVHPSSDMRTTSMTPRKPASISPLPASPETSLSNDDQSSHETSTTLEAPVELESFDPIEPNVLEDTSLNNGLKPEDVPPPIDLDRPINTELTSQIDSLLSGNSVETPAAAPIETAAPAPVSTPAPLPETETPETETPEAASQPVVGDTQTNQPEDDGLDFEETPDLSRMSTEPLTSPFIEGVAVDKRPLGSASSTSQSVNVEPVTSAPEPAPELTPEPTPEVADKKPGYSEELKHPDDVTARDVLPDELDNKLVSIESSTAAGAKTSSDEAKLDMSNESTGPTSIAKQYKEKARTDDQDTSSDIFDTKNYHKPIKDETKAKRMSPLVIVAIIIFVILLIAAGVFGLLWSGLFTLPF